MLQAIGVSVRFGGVAALTDVTVAVAPGEIVGLIGPNGAGKSTLVNVMSGFQHPMPGQVFLNGRNVTRDKAHERAIRGISRTFQAARLFANLSVAQNIAVPAIAHGHPPAESERLAKDLLAWMEMAGLADQKGGALAYAEERKVAIARSLAAQPSYLLLDEPAAGMSEADANYLAEKIREIPGRFGCSVLLIEHNINMVMNVCDRVAVLNFGRLLALGTPGEILENEAVVSAYLGESE
ncbi:ABC transporter related (plasmid) [Rhizobium leguminosarum bv. trifolii WSM2304]|uniref:ABC transporter related n=1 Tax=Rhizobium leguminosarum bv. trifolii (strain WSM2304) TaxID=395492 RepID=A0ABF7QZ75_RHILW|nr:ABC transporter ATP-binding protein [Rhizobium leguminosarum]ACI59489.1 ABC transporter related [Rhizobium leguminosarum bv. trifolii WSM2304]